MEALNGTEPHTDSQLVSLPREILGIILSSDSIDELGCTIMIYVCKRTASMVRGNTLKRIEICRAAAKYGYIKIFTWARAIKCPMGHDITEIAAEHGHLEFLRYLRSFVKCSRDYRASVAAARGGHIEILEWMWTRGFEFNFRLWIAAAESNNLDVLKWAHKNKIPSTSYAGTHALRSGQLEMAQWLFSIGELSIFRACEYAAYGGNLELIKWLRNMGCVWDELVVYLARQFGYTDIEEWAIANGCPQ